MQYLIPFNPETLLPRPKKRRRTLVKKKAQRPQVVNYEWQDNGVDKIPHEILSLCAQVRSELVKLEANSGRRSQLFRATEALVKPGAGRLVKQLKKNGGSIAELAKRMGWNEDRTMRLVSGQEVPRFWEIPKIASALKVETPVLLAAYGYPKETFETAEAMVHAIMMEAERK